MLPTILDMTERRQRCTLATHIDKPRIALASMLAIEAQPKNRCIFLHLRVVRLSPALPGRFARDAPSLSHHHPASVWSRPRPADFSFRASAFASAPDVSELPPRIRYPLRAGACHLVRAGGNRYITEAHRLYGAALLSGGVALGGSM